jgi:hypothetical protein
VLIEWGLNWSELNLLKIIYDWSMSMSISEDEHEYEALESSS